jgi:hemoglobin-like flavoprotein
MANPLFNTFGNNMTNEMFNQLFQQAIELKRTLKVNPQQLVQNMLNNGTISQQDFNRVFPFAMQLGEKMSKR